MWTYAGARRKEKRISVWAWTAMMKERDGSKWMDFEVALLRLLDRLPDAECYESNANPP